MNDTTDTTRKMELLSAIQNSVGDAREAVQKSSQDFSDLVKPLRMAESDDVFVVLSDRIEALQLFMEFAGHLSEGVKLFDGFGIGVDPITSDDAGIRLFQDMQSALETKDMVMLSDLIEYELSPLLTKEDEWLSVLDDKVQNYSI